ncbi:uncharacterized protein [Lepeophtheirus salmonis]|uniref:uncharacterized protein n=1 Tax=Lepeophtheirus salmonis TaxID=72036 RepID=UPI001AE3A189|nr:uncharacterized protein LOC121128473 [Lepeophtheirus salmonis]
MIPRIILFVVIFFIQYKGIWNVQGNGIFDQFDSLNPSKLFEQYVVGKIKEYQKTNTASVKQKLLGMICPNCNKCPIDMCKNFCSQKCKEFEEKSKEKESENPQTSDENQEHEEESKNSGFKLNDFLKKISKKFYETDGIPSRELEPYSTPSPIKVNFKKKNTLQKLEKIFYSGDSVPLFGGFESSGSETKKQDKYKYKDLSKLMDFINEVLSFETGTLMHYLPEFENFLQVLSKYCGSK